MAFEIMGIRVEEWTFDHLHSFILQRIEKKQKARVLNVNVYAMNLCFSDPEFYQILKEAEAVFCDGDGVRLAANWKGGKIPHKITYAHWMPLFFEWASKSEISLFFLGARQEVVEKAVIRVKKQFPYLKIHGFCNGYETDEICFEKICMANADVVIVGKGMPLQEKWIEKNWQSLPGFVWLSGGAVFDYLSAETRRAPAWMIRLNMEWLYRFFQEPKRMFSRYILGNPLFLWRVLTKQSPR